MPNYGFQCYLEDGGCDHIFEIKCSMEEISNKSPKCPNCHKKKSVFRLFNDVYVYDGTPKTVGSLAERNCDKMSDDQRHAIANKHKTVKPKFSPKLPEGASLLPVDNKGNKVIPTRKGKDFGRPKNAKPKNKK